MSKGRLKVAKATLRCNGVALNVAMQPLKARSAMADGDGNGAQAN